MDCRLLALQLTLCPCWNPFHHNACEAPFCQFPTTYPSGVLAGLPTLGSLSDISCTGIPALQKALPILVLQENFEVHAIVNGSAQSLTKTGRAEESHATESPTLFRHQGRKDRRRSTQDPSKKLLTYLRSKGFFCLINHTPEFNSS